MNQRLITTGTLVILILGYIELKAYCPSSPWQAWPTAVVRLVTAPLDEWKPQASQILEAKGHACHCKQNLFMVFSLNNMERRAVKVYNQVILRPRMSQEDEIRSMLEGYATLKKYLETQNNN